jgi:hypothetical protein
VESLVHFLNRRYADDDFNRVDFGDVRRLASTYSRSCDVDAPGEVPAVEHHEGFISGLAQLALDGAEMCRRDPRRGPPEQVPPGIWFGNEDAVVSAETPWPLTPRE